jgi:hypothetical protein
LAPRDLDGAGDVEDNPGRVASGGIVKFTKMPGALGNQFNPFENLP